MGLLASGRTSVRKSDGTLLYVGKFIVALRPKVSHLVASESRRGGDQRIECFERAHFLAVESKHEGQRGGMVCV
jgi:hypothetical protein